MLGGSALDGLFNAVWAPPGVPTPPTTPCRPSTAQWSLYAHITKPGLAIVSAYTGPFPIFVPLCIRQRAPQTPWGLISILCRQRSITIASISSLKRHKIQKHKAHRLLYCIMYAIKRTVFDRLYNGCNRYYLLGIPTI